MNLLARYVAREVLGATGLVLIALLLLYAFFDLVFQLPDLGKGNYKLSGIFFFVALSLPGHVYELFPIAALIGTLYALSQLNSHSELTVMRTSGVSLAAIAGTLVLVGIVFGAINMGFGEVIAPYSDDIARRYRLESMNTMVAQEFRSGLWVRDARTFVNIKEMLPDGTLRNLKIYEFDEAKRLKSISQAERGQYDSKVGWQLIDVQRTNFRDDTVQLERLPRAPWATAVRPDILSVLLVVPEQMSVWNLFTYIEHLRENKQNTTRQEIAQWSKLLHPFVVVVLMILALPFSIHQVRAGGVSGKIFMGVMLGLGFHLLNRLFMSLGVLNNWNPLASAGMPAVLFLALALTMMTRAETR
jgi:lipopolysaccharide export system permease protein